MMADIDYDRLMAQLKSSIQKLRGVTMDEAQKLMGRQDGNKQNNRS